MNMTKKLSAWLGIAASAITVLTFFGVKNVDQLGQAVQPASNSSSGAITNTAITNTAVGGLCLDTDGPQGPGVPVQVRDCGNWSGQIWSYDQNADRLANPPSGLCLDTEGNPAAGVSLVVNPCGNYTGQQWRYDTGSGQFTNLTSGLCLDTDGNPANDVGLVLNPCGNYTGQEWHTGGA